MAFELSKSLNGLLNSLSVPSLGPEQRADSMPLSRLKDKLETTISQANLRGENADLVRSTVLLWHDHLNESHTISQGINSSDGSYLHAIMHRREPDYSNAQYWFNRTGNHPAFRQVHQRAEEFLDPFELHRKTGWNVEYTGMVDAVSQVHGECDLLQQVQRIEFEVLLERFCS